MKTEMQNQQETSQIEADDDDDVKIVEMVKSNVTDEEEKESVVIDIKCGDGEALSSSSSNNKEKFDGGETVCRICHLSSSDYPPSSSENLELVQLGCGCKDELGIAHRHCGEAWFMLKGNRCCEICGEAAKNITGVGDNRFMKEWNERSDGTNGNANARRRIGQPLCNFLMACLVIAFVLPWFLRANMF